MNDTPHVSRRAVLTGAGVGAAVAIGPAARAAHRTSRFFRHGVASGDPRPTEVILWTRVTPTESARPGSGEGPSVTVSWQVATEPGFTDVVSSGDAYTGTDRDHTVKVLARELAPATDYYYRFSYGGRLSTVGRTRTAPAPDAQPDSLRLGFVSCANLQAGWFSVYRHLADRDDLDAVLHLGDYLYEYGPDEYGYGSANTNVREHRPAHEAVSLRDYRKRHAQYKADADLQRLHARHPLIAVWDDHEVANNTWQDGARNHQPKQEGDFGRRKRRARRAYDEWMPTELGDSTALRDGQQIYRSLRFGRLADLSMLDLRSYRSQQARDVDGPVDDPARTITGDLQMSWLKEQLTVPDVQWKLVGSSVMMAPVVRPPVSEPVARALDELTGVPRADPGRGQPLSLDSWSGYTADQREVWDHLSANGVKDVVFLTGDVHTAWANEVPLDASTYPSPSVATEFVCASVTSNNFDDAADSGPPRTSSLALETRFREKNPFVKRVNLDDHGYCVLDVTAERAQVDWFVISDRTDRNATTSWQASFATDTGTQKLQSVDAPVA